LLVGTIERHHCKTFDQSAKNLIMIAVEDKMIRDELGRVI
jgi:hypothetical protein